MKSRNHLVVAAASVGLAILLIAYGLIFGVPFGPVMVLMVAALLIGGLVYGVAQSRRLSPRALTGLHAVAWILLLVGLLYRFPLSIYVGGMSALGAIFSYGILPLIILVVFIGCVIAVIRKRNGLVVNSLIFSSGLLAFQLVGLMVFLPGVAAH